MSRESVSECKRKNRDLVERADSMKTQLSDSELRCSELETQLKHAHNVMLI